LIGATTFDQLEETFKKYFVSGAKDLMILRLGNAPSPEWLRKVNRRRVSQGLGSVKWEISSSAKKM